MALNLSLLITHHLRQTNLSCHPEKPPCWLGSSRLISMTSILQPANEKLLPQDRLSAREIRLHTCSKIPITCQELKREPRFERGCREKTLICDRLFASVDRAKRSISASSRTSIYPITINYHTLESIKLSRVTYNNFQHIGHAWGEPMALVLPTRCLGRRSLASKLSIIPLHSASHHAVNLCFPMDQLSVQMPIRDWSFTVLRSPPERENGRRRLNKLTRHGQYCDVNQDVVSPVSICICPFLISSPLLVFIYDMLKKFPHKDRYCWQTKLNHRTAYFVHPSTFCFFQTGRHDILIILLF